MLLALCVSIAFVNKASSQDFEDSVSKVPTTSETRMIEATTSQGVNSGVLISTGEWGKLHSSELILEPPDLHVRPNSEMLKWTEGTVWSFEQDLPSVIRILQHAGLDEYTISTLTSPPFLAQGIGRIEIRPPDSVILELSPQTRNMLYPHLGSTAKTNYFRFPIRLMSGGYARMSQSPTGLSANMEDLISRLCYVKEGGAVHISDIRFLFSQAENEAERLRIIKTLSRETSLNSWLDLSRPLNKESLVSYWSANGKNPGAITILDAVLESPEIDRIELVHLLPPVAKKLLHTYAEPEQGVGTHLPDCHSTSFSFFSNSLPPRMLDSVGAVANERYVRATKPWQFGDVILIKDADGNWVHACNYIAGEIVFTKNGQSLGRPWVLQTFNEVFASYMENSRMQAFFFRLKPEYRE